MHGCLAVVLCADAGAARGGVYDFKGPKAPLVKLLKSALQKNVRLRRPGPSERCFRKLLEARTLCRLHLEHLPR